MYCKLVERNALINYCVLASSKVHACNHLAEWNCIVITHVDHKWSRILLQLNAGCFAAKVPLVSGAAIRMEGQITVFTYQDGEPCYHCLSRLFGENALTCVEAGVMAPLIGVIGSLQAMEAIKLLAGYGKPASGKIVMYDAMTCQFREMKLMRNPGCEVCGQ